MTLQRSDGTPMVGVPLLLFPKTPPTFLKNRPCGEWIWDENPVRSFGTPQNYSPAGFETPFSDEKEF